MRAIAKKQALKYKDTGERAGDGGILKTPDEKDWSGVK